MNSKKAMAVIASLVWFQSGCCKNTRPAGTMISTEGPNVSLFSGQAKTIEIAGISHWVPKHVGNGDQDFDGHGPNVNASVKLVVRNGKIWADLVMRAKETKSDLYRSGFESIVCRI